MANEPHVPVLVATDLTEHSEPALLRGRAIADARSAPLFVMHVVPDVLRHHPLMPSREENDVALAIELEKKVGELVSRQVERVLGLAPDRYRIIIEIGDAEDEIVRVAEEQHVSLICVGAKPRHGAERLLGHVSERVIRYAHTSVLVARRGAETRKVLVTTDFSEASLHALRFASMLVDKLGMEATLLHVMQLPKATPLTPVLSTLGSAWVPPPKPVIEQLEKLGLETLRGLAQQYHFQHVEQLEGDPDEVIVARAEAIDAEMIVMASHGRTGLRRLVLGSTTEKVTRSTQRSVVVTRGA